MFRAAPMMRLHAVVLAQDERSVLKGLGQLGAMHLTRMQSGPDTAPLAPIDHTGELTRYDRIRTRVQELRKALDIPLLSKEAVEIKSSQREREGLFEQLKPFKQEGATLPAGGQAQAPLNLSSSLSEREGVAPRALLVEGATQAPLNLSSSLSEREGVAPRALLVEGATQAPLIEDTLLALEQRSAGLLEKRLRLMRRRKELAATCERVSYYRGLEIPLDGLDQFSFLHFVTGSLPAQNLERLGKEVGDNVALLPLVQQKGQLSLFAITTRQGRPALERALQQADFQREMLPVVEGTTVDRFSEEGQKEQEQLTAELEQLNGRLREISAEFLLPLAEIEGFVDMECLLLDASQKFPRTGSTVLIAGWVPASDVEVLEKRLGEITNGRYAIQTVLPDNSKEEQVPVLLKHSWLLRPFEMLVSTYGLPNYRELEPTLFVALSYLVMFGMMFGDAGHGFVLALCGLIALLAGRSEKVRDVGLLLFFGGFSSMISGVVYGSYFGIEVFKKYALWHDPLEGDPMRLMYGAIGIGIVMISLGLILNVINRFRRGDVIGGILDKFGLIGILFYWGTLVLLMYGETIRSRGLMVASVIAFFVVPIVGWSLKQPIEYFLRRNSGEQSEAGGEGLVSAIIESCVEAFEAVLSYLANTISFVRLAAYAMSHAALIFAAFMLAAVVRDFHAGGGLWSLLVIIIGNLVAIVLEGIIASVQALRLEYYEFFGKFYSGSGQPFEPFSLARIKNSNG